MLVRFARPEDAPALHVLNELFNGEGSNAERAIASSLAHNRLELVCVAEEQSELVGFCCGQLFDSLCYNVRYAEVTELFVLESHRRRGIASRLMGFMEQAFAALGIFDYQLFTGVENAGAQTLYRGLGYAESAERMFRKRIPHPQDAPPNTPSNTPSDTHSGAYSGAHFDEVTIYFIRHAESDHAVREDFIRPLTARGLADAERLPEALAGVRFDRICSSPYLRAVQTVWPLARAQGLHCELIEGLHEQRVGEWVEDFRPFAEKQWADFHFRLPGGESLADTQARMIGALHRLVEGAPGQTLAIGTHGEALSTVLRYYRPGFGFADFWRIVPLLPYVIRLRLRGTECVGMEEIPLNR